MPKIVDLKSTLNLPGKAFPMKANLPQNEPKQLAEWEETKLYHRIQQARAGAPSYVLHDGPPYPTGTIHLGTGLNQNFERHGGEVENHGGVSRALRARMGLPRPAH